MHWIFLLAAIATELVGVMAMKLAATDSGLLPIIIMITSIGLSFFLLALAVKTIPVAVAYATWEGVGLMAVTLLSMLLFGEQIGWQKLAGLFAIFCGVVMMERGIEDRTDQRGIQSC